jgi:hypothetical protein
MKERLRVLSLKSHCCGCRSIGIEKERLAGYQALYCQETTLNLSQVVLQ